MNGVVHLKKKQRPILTTKLFTSVLVAASATVLFFGYNHTKRNQEINANQHESYMADYEERVAQKENLINAINEDIPGIIAWGDSLTAGAGGEGVDYPSVLQKLIADNVYKIPVVNMGVGGETTNTILGRSGSQPFVVSEFTIPENNEKAEIFLSSSNGQDVAPLIRGDAGVNPVSINGVEGVISIDQESDTSGEYSYYFQRTKSGDEVEVDDNTFLMTDASEKYNNYVPIIFIGQNGGFEDTDDLISQINSVLEMEKYNEKFLVLGLTTGSSISRADLEEKMESEYGSNYINLREYIVENGLEQVGIDPTAEDSRAVAEGFVPPSLLFDAIHFTDMGYTVIGNAVFERMQELEYFNEIQSNVEALDNL